MSIGVPETPIFTVLEAAEFLKCTTNFVRLLMRRGKLPYQRVGKKYVVPVKAVHQYLDSSWQVQGVRTGKAA